MVPLQLPPESGDQIVEFVFSSHFASVHSRCENGLNSDQPRVAAFLYGHLPRKSHWNSQI